MKAAICTRYGAPDVVEVRNVPIPDPKPGDVLIHILASTVTSGDCRVRGYRVPLALWLPLRLLHGIKRPKHSILGTELSGRIVSTGKKVTRFRPGEAIFAMTDLRFGAHAQYIVLPDTACIMPMPANLSFPEAAAIAFGGTTALYFLRKSGLKKGDSILVYGASGAVGTYAVQLAKHMGAKVSGACGYSNKFLVKSLGADEGIDYINEPLCPIHVRYNVVFDAVGKLSKSRSQAMLAPGGRFVSVAYGWPKKCMEDLDRLRLLLASGEIHPVIDRIYPLEQIVEAYRYVETGHKKKAM